MSEPIEPLKSFVVTEKRIDNLIEPTIQPRSAFDRVWEIIVNRTVCDKDIDRAIKAWLNEYKELFK